MSKTQQRYLLWTAGICFATIFIVQRVDVLRNYVYGTQPTSGAQQTQ